MASVTVDGELVDIRFTGWERLAAVLTAGAAAGAVPRVESAGADRLRVRGLDAPGIADLAAAHRLRVYELAPETPGLEQLFLHLTTDKAASR